MPGRFRSYYSRLLLQFNQPAKTSRNTLLQKQSYFLFIEDIEKAVCGIGECSAIPGLSIDNETTFVPALEKMVHAINNGTDLHEIDCTFEFPAIQFGFETAVADLNNGGKRILFNTAFSAGKEGIPINGLVWMADIETMKQQAAKKIDEGFDCIKLKIGTYHFSDELELVKYIRKEFPANIELRLDANGAYSFADAKKYLRILSDYQIHSIEQPIKQGNWDEMAELCENPPINIALDEELIGINGLSLKTKMLDHIHPQYIILKPSLIGGLKSADEWIQLADKKNIRWWATSALESNIGLNAISQWISDKQTNLAQGLGTGMIYKNNIESPLKVDKGYLFYQTEISWNTEKLI